VKLRLLRDAAIIHRRGEVVEVPEEIGRLLTASGAAVELQRRAVRPKGEQRQSDR